MKLKRLKSQQTHPATTVFTIAIGAVIASFWGNSWAASQNGWSPKMRELRDSYQDLLIDLSSDSRFNDPKNFGKIEKKAQKFAELARSINVATSPDADPSLEIVVSQFAAEATHAAKTLRWGARSRNYARERLKSMTSYCVACHTRSPSGPQFDAVNVSSAVQSLRALERADFHAAVRKFDLALEDYESVLSDRASAQSRPFDWERAGRSALAIAIRVKKDPDRAIAIVDRILAAPKAPFYLREQATQWKVSLQSWKSDSKPKPQTEEGHYALAQQLVAEARAMQKFPLDRSADVLFLRASSAVHDLLSFAPNGARAADGLLLAGLCYEVLRDLNLWDQHEFYYLACVMKNPHSSTAQQCFRRYEESVFSGYTGSGGTSVPPEEREKLERLNQLAAPKGATKPL